MPPTARRSSTATRRTPARRTRSTAPQAPSIPAGQRACLLELPWERPPGLPSVTYYRALKAHARIGESLPGELLLYAAKPYSYLRWVEDHLNGEAGPGAVGPVVTPTAAQIEDARVIVDAAASNFRGATGSGSATTGSPITGRSATTSGRAGNSGGYRRRPGTWRGAPGQKGGRSVPRGPRRPRCRRRPEPVSSPRA